MRNLSMKVRLIAICTGCIMFTGLLLIGVSQYLLARAFSANEGAIRRSAEISLQLAAGALEQRFDCVGRQDPCPEDRSDAGSGDIDRARPGVEAAAVAGAIQGETQSQVRSDMLRWSGVLVLVLAATAVAAALVVANRFLHPVRVLTSAAERLSTHDLHERIEVQPATKELVELAHSFNQMLGRLEAAFESQDRFISNASHQLKTPLAIMRTHIDVAQQDGSPERMGKALDVLNRMVTRTERLINALLRLARSEHATEDHEVDLTGVFTEALEEAKPRLEAKKLRITTELDPCVLTGDPDLLRQVVDNLLDNSIVHNRREGWVNIRTVFDGECCLLAVRSSGEPVPATAIKTLFQPFTRASGERLSRNAGAGLGLAIVRAAVESSGGSVSAQPVPGGGLDVRARFPPWPRGSATEALQTRGS